MKRHPALVHLSREHHSALILARLLQKNAPAYRNLPGDTAEKVIYALHFYEENLILHFEKEEKILKLVAGINAPLDLLIEEIFLEHQKLHGLFKTLNNHPDIPAHLDELGKSLEMHIRKEERELFPLIENVCSEEVLISISKSLTSN